MLQIKDHCYSVFLTMVSEGPPSGFLSSYVNEVWLDSHYHVRQWKFEIFHNWDRNEFPVSSRCHVKQVSVNHILIYLEFIRVYFISKRLLNFCFLKVNDFMHLCNATRGLRIVNNRKNEQLNSIINVLVENISQ